MNGKEFIKKKKFHQNVTIVRCDVEWLLDEYKKHLDKSAPVDDGVDKLLRENLELKAGNSVLSTENALLKKRVDELEADVDKLLNLCRRKY